MNRIRGMWRLVILAFTTSVYAQQNSRRPEPYDNGHGWDIRLAVPGQPGDDYPVLNSIPRTQFSCSGKSPGYYSDVDTGCQVFRVCTLGATYGFQSFLCPNGTLFNQEVLVCDWWMNVNCERSPQRYNDNSEKFGNLKLGPQLMNDIKKMLTHPMRYPYDKGMMKSNLIVMQDYKPPSGQLLFPNGALIAGPERSPNNIYVPSKQRPANFAQNSFLSGDLSFAASTPSSQYIPSSSNSIRPTERNTVVLQQQRQNLQLAQNGQTGTLYNNQRVQPTYPTNTEFINNNNNNRILPSPYFQNQNQNQRHIQQSQSTSQTLLNNQAQRELSQYNNQIIKKQHEYGISNTNQQYTNFPKHNGQAVEKNNIPQFSRDVNGFVGRAAKQNLALVYSFLADSINAAKKYNNIVKETVVSPTPIQAQNPNLNDEDIGDITAKISQLTSSQFTNNNQKNANYVLPPRQTTGNDYGRDVTKYTTDHSQRQYPQNHHLNSQLSLQNTPDQLYSSRLQRLSSNNLVQNGQKTQNQIYSGQLYKLPVPEVTRQIYNIPNHIQASNARLTNELGTRYSLRDANQNDNANNIIKQSNNDIQIVQSESLPNPPTTQQLPRSDESTFNTQDISGNIYAENFLDTDTGITTQVQDKIIGTLPHPLEENKLVTYEKNKSYYLYTKLEDDSNDNIHNTNTIVQSNDHNNQQNAKFIQGNDLTNRITFELFPSIGYELQNEREKQQILNALKVTDISNSKHNGRTESFNKRQGELVTGVDFTILHPTSKKQVGQYNNANTILYRGPSSYLAPQSSVGSLGGNQQLKSITNSNIEQLEDNNNNGYSKTVPARQFSF
ncbi:uncharacterized protein [Epargyreus clarus]|uniref:uncharacterized protein isoform X2 n=1 Tax=Epargyreus clarus TaxID=520877 RepID=UPI003C2F738D